MNKMNNPYWDAVKNHINWAGSLWHTPVVDWLRYDTTAPRRTDLVRQYAWTVTDPETVEFVAEYAGARVVDPMAGTGYFAWLLQQAGAEVDAYDLHPPAVLTEANKWHCNVSTHYPVRQADAAEIVGRYGRWTLLLSWPPYGFDAAPILAAYPGQRLIYIGEGEWGCCADDGFFAALDRDWLKVADHVPVQWDSMHDKVTVYDRRTSDGGEQHG